MRPIASDVARCVVSLCVLQNDWTDRNAVASDDERAVSERAEIRDPTAAAGADDDRVTEIPSRRKSRMTEQRCKR